MGHKRVVARLFPVVDGGTRQQVCWLQNREAFRVGFLHRFRFLGLFVVSWRVIGFHTLQGVRNFRFNCNVSDMFGRVFYFQTPIKITLSIGYTPIPLSNLQHLLGYHTGAARA